MEAKLVIAALLGIISSLVSAQVCNNAIGVGDSSIIGDQAFSASSDDGVNLPQYARLNQASTKAWCSKPNATNNFIKVTLPGTYQVTEIAIQGLNGSGDGNYVKSFQFEYIYQGGKYEYSVPVNGPTSKTDIAREDLTLFDTVYAEAVIIKPLETNPAYQACLRFELYGCMPAPATTPKPTTTPIDYCKQNNGGCEKTCTSQSSGPVCSCPSGFILDKDNKTCNVDYCKKNNGGCEVSCKNSKNGPVCGCHSGFEVASDGKNCTDINECWTSSDLCDDVSTTCINTEGSYVCHCKNNFKRKDRYTCIDINECDEGTHNCNHKCINIVGGFRCACHDGYRLNRDGHTCDDKNECKENNKCNTTVSTCVNIPGSYKCDCFSGLVNDPKNSDTCIDRNECDYGNGGCNHGCVNLYRSYRCECKRGYHLSADNHTCVDNNECAVNNGGCAQNCHNFDGGYRCSCRNGFDLTPDFKGCIDINECDNYNGGCEKYCTNTIGSFRCSCDTGYKAVDKTCADIDECKDNLHDCERVISTCYNTQGSFVCRCNQGYTMNPTTKKCEALICKSPVTSPANGFVEPSRCLQYDSNKYTEVCKFKCNSGFQLRTTSAAYAYCDSDGYFKYPYGKATPYCEKIRCPALTGIPNGSVYPSDCVTRGVEFGSHCHVACNGGYTSSGKISIQCLQSGKFDGNFMDTKCVARPKITCPPHITEILPLGKGSMKIKLGKINTNVAPEYLTSSVAGVLEGTHEFKPGYTPIRLRAMNALGDASECSFSVTIKDNEPPKVFDCDAENQYINIDGKEAVVTWKEPRFVDNAGISTKPKPTIPNGALRKPQVYFVAYHARDDSGNTASCKFFVHVKAKYCDKDKMPGAHNIQSSFGTGGRFYLTCSLGKQFSDSSISSFGGGTFGIADCANGDWTPPELPSCVETPAKQGDCPAGTQEVLFTGTQTPVCAYCPIGKYNNQTQGKCKKCPKGYYQDEDGKTSCKQCPAGSTTETGGSVAMSACKAQCEKGSYSKDGLKSLSGCEKCPQGSYQEFDGSTHCKICPMRGETSGDGSTAEAECHVAARIIKVVPTSQEYYGIVGSNVTIECSATGSPVPHLQIASNSTLPAEELRGKSTISALPSASKYVVTRRLTIENAQIGDTATYKCVAQNPSVSGRAVDERFIKLVIEAPKAIGN